MFGKLKKSLGAKGVHVQFFFNEGPAGLNSSVYKVLF